MDDKEFQEQLKEIRTGLRLVDSMLLQRDDGSYVLTETQHNLVKRLFEVFDRAGWELAFANRKGLEVTSSKAIKDGNCLFGHKTGDLVRIRPCAEEHEGETYLGIFIGDAATGIAHRCGEDGIVKASMSGYNPAILIPELGKVVYGYESWWGVIESEEELDRLITDETIANVWYVKALKAMHKPEPSNEN